MKCQWCGRLKSHKHIVQTPIGIIHTGFWQDQMRIESNLEINDTYTGMSEGQWQVSGGKE